MAAVLALAACETTELLPEGLSFARASDDTPGTIITTIPTDALLTHPGGSCRTPCQVAYPEKVQVQLAKEGYAPVKINIPVGARDTTLEMRAVGRTTEVEEVTLPEL
ncbi:MAG: hypothetical protein AAF830_08310 [Pseudomonadota bacterium]